MKAEEFVALVVVVLFMLVMFVIGGMTAERFTIERMQKKAIEAKVAYWDIDGQTGKVEFKYKVCGE